jgi:hypothetical protein
MSSPEPRLPDDIYPDHNKPHIAVILGAGFSRCAGLPLQKQFLDDLLTDEPPDPRNRVITEAITKFFEFTFGWQKGTPLPELEDIFTMIDLSAGSGHALGTRYPPRVLRALRRMLIHRVFSILDRRFNHSADIQELLVQLFKADSNTCFIVLNWDIVLEKHMQAIGRAASYEANELPWNGPPAPSPFPVRVAKVHGSANWVYCDNCRQVFDDQDSKLSLDINAGLLDDDFRLFDSIWPADGIKNLTGRVNRDCTNCRSPVGPHIATFSYRKSFRSTAFTRSWAAAETNLSQANRWLFVGYSLPHADFEFAHLLKTAELKLARPDLRPIRMHVIVKDDADAERRFRQMFGTALEPVEQAGLQNYLKHGIGGLVT